MKEAGVASPHVVAGEYLVDAIDRILEAFQVGEGIMNNAPEPITLDIARRQIWRLVRETLRGLAEETGSASATVWLRAAIPQAAVEAQDRLLTVLGDSPGWCIRCYGPRREGEPTVFYITGMWDFGAMTPIRLRDLVRDLRGHGFEIRDFTYIDSALHL